MPQHFTRRQQVTLGILGAVFLTVLTCWLTQVRPTTSPVSVTSVGFTNVDSFGGWQPFSLAHFRLTNHSSATLACALGPVEFRIGNEWVRDTNRLAIQYGRILRPHASAVMTVALPPRATRLRTSLRSTPPPGFSQSGMRRELDQLLRKLGVQWRPKPAPPIIVPYEVAIE